MANAQIPGVAPVVFTQDDFKDPELTKFNEFIRQVVTTINALVGANGNVPFTKSIDLQGNSLLNAVVSFANQIAQNASAGSGPAPPANVSAFLVVTVGTQQYKIPLFSP